MLTGAKPGEIFTHRNIANQAHPTDLNMLAALEYAIEVLDVRHVLVCGHYNCGGVKAAMSAPGHMLVDHWLQIVRDVHLRHRGELDELPDEAARFKRLVELNVLEQVVPALAHAGRAQHWLKGRRPILHGLVYDINDGLLKELVSGVDGEDRANELRAARSLASGRGSGVTSTRSNTSSDCATGAAPTATAQRRTGRARRRPRRVSATAVVRLSTCRPCRRRRRMATAGRRLVFLLLDDQRFGREEEARDGRRVLQRRASHLRRIDDAGLHEVLVLVGRAL